MAKGKAKSTLLGIQGIVAHRSAPDYQFLYEHSTTKNSNYDIGDRVVLPDGRVFRYGLAVNSVAPGSGVKFSGTTSDDGVASAVNRAQAIGDKEVRFASETFAKDELRGGYVIIYSAGDTYQQFGIVGNTECSNSELTIYLDRAIAVVVTSTQYVEVLPNPYRYLKHESSAWMSHAGIPMSAATVGQYFWVQTWGPCWVNPQYGVGGETAERMVIFGPDGSLRHWGWQANLETGYQTAGFVILATSQGSDAGPSFLMLQISP